MKVKKTSQLTVKAANKAGELAKILGAVSEAKVNILAYAGWTEGKQGYVTLVTENNVKAVRALKKAGYSPAKSDVVIVHEADKVGRGAAMAEKLAKARINLKSAYATCAGGNYVTVLQAPNASKLLAALK